MAMRAAIAMTILAGSLASCASGPPTPLIAENRVWGYDAQLPACDDAKVLDAVRSRFATKEADYWKSSLTIATVERVRPIGFRPWSKSFIPRRYCTASVMTSDGRRRRLDYSIIEDGGIAGLSWGLAFCVTGVDRNMTYAPDCRMARP